MALAATSCTVLVGCEKTFRDMYDQPKYKPLAASPLWADGRSARLPPSGSVLRSMGTLAGTTSGREGAAPAISGRSAVDRGTWTPAVLARGRERFDIFCTPCHGAVGDGDGMVVRRGFPAPASLHDERLRLMSDARIDTVIARGYGVMYPLADRVPPSDRNAIVAYVRALQLSQDATLADVPPGKRHELGQTR